MLILVVSGGCGADFFDQTIEIEIPEHESLLAISCRIKSKDSLSLAFITHSQGILIDSQAVILHDVQASIQIDDVFSIPLIYNEDLNFDPFYGGFYIGVNSKPEERLLFEATHAEFGSVTSSQIVPLEVPIQKLDHKKGDSQGSISRGDEIIVQFQDPPNQKNYYLLQASIKRQFAENMFFTDGLFLSTDDPLLSDSQFDTDFELQFVFDDSSIDGEQYKLKMFSEELTDFPPVAGDSLIIELHSLSRDSYLYERSYRLYEKSKDNPFAEPVVVHGNVNGGYGIFTYDAVSISKLTF